VIAQWHASVDRVLGLVEALNDLEQQQSACTEPPIELE